MKENIITGKTISNQLSKRLAKDMVEDYAGYNISYLQKSIAIVTEVIGENGVIHTSAAVREAIDNSTL